MFQTRKSLGTAFIADGLREEKIAIVGENSYGWCCSFFGVMNRKIWTTARKTGKEDLLKDKGITDPQKYFEDQVKILNARMSSYKAVKRVKLRDTEFQKNTSRKITRFSIDKTID